MPMLPMIEAVLRTHYRLLRVPLAVFEQHLSRPAGQGSAVHSACRQVLITCDRTAAHVLRDGTAGHAADRTEQRHTADRHARPETTRPRPAGRSSTRRAPPSIPRQPLPGWTHLATGPFIGDTTESRQR